MGIILIDIKLLPRTTDFDFWMSVVVSQIDRQGREERLLSQDFETGSIASIVQVHQNFQSLYQEWSTYAQGGEIPLRIGRGLTITPNQIGNYSQSDERAKKDRCNQELSNAIEQLSDWLDRSISTKFIDSIRDKVKDLTTCQIRLAIEVSKPQLQDLPWDKCTNSKLINRLSDFVRSINTIVSMSNVQGSKIWSNIRKILIIQGYNEDIDTDADVTFIKRHLPRYIVSVTEDKPSLIRFNQLLWDEQWDAIFYLGHTETNFAGDDGIIRINHTETVSIDDLSNAFSKAVDRGLQMLVFNSCSGMGLARQLDRILRDRQKRSPYVIVMRRLIGDSIAHIFIDRFAQHLFKDKLSIEQAITQARNFMKTENVRFPGADSLVALWCNGRALPLKISPDIRQRILHSWLFAPQLATKLFGYKMKIPPIAIIGIVLGAAVVGYNSIVPTPEPMASMGEHLLFAQKTSPNKQLGIEAFSAKDYVRAIEKLELATRQQANDPEAQIYLNNARALQQSNDPDKLPIIPVVGSKSNGFQTGQEILRGAAIAQMHINQKGGIKNQQILIKIIVDNNDNKEAIQVANKLIKDPTIKGVVGHLNSNASVTVAPIYQANGLVMLTPVSSTMDLTGKGNFIFRTTANSEMIANTLADYIINISKKKKLGICSNSKLTSGTTFEKSFNGAISSRGGKILTSSCDLTDNNLSPQAIVEQMVNQGADGLVFYFHADDGIDSPDMQVAQKIARAAKQLKLPLFGPHALIAPDILKLGANYEGMILATPRHPESPLASKFTSQARAIFGEEPTWRDMTAYDATVAIAAGLNLSDGTRYDLQKKLHDPNFSIDGSSGPIKFSQNGDRVMTSSIAQVQYQGNKYKFTLIPAITPK